MRAYRSQLHLFTTPLDILRAMQRNSHDLSHRLKSSCSFRPHLHPAAAAAAAAVASINYSERDEILVKRATVTGFVVRLMRNINSDRTRRRCADSKNVGPLFSPHFH